MMDTGTSQHPTGHFMEHPKSASTAVAVLTSSSWSTSTLSGLTSRWATPLANKCCAAASNSTLRRCTTGHGSTPVPASLRRRINVASVDSWYDSSTNWVFRRRMAPSGPGTSACARANSGRTAYTASGMRSTYSRRKRTTPACGGSRDSTACSRSKALDTVAVPWP